MTQTTDHMGEENKINHETKSEETKETSNADSGCTAQATWGTPQKDSLKKSFDLKTNTQVSFDEEKEAVKETKDTWGAQDSKKESSWGTNDTNKKSSWGTNESKKEGWGNNNNWDQKNDSEDTKRRKFDEPGRRTYNDPAPAKTLGLFGLSVHATQEDLEEFLKENIPDIPYENFTLVKDRVTGESRGFAFLHFESIEKATQAKEKLDGKNMKDTPVRVAFSISKGNRRENFGSGFEGGRGDRPRGGFEGRRDNFQRGDDFNDRRSFGRRDDFNDRRPSDRRDDYNDRRQEGSWGRSRDHERTEGFPRRDDFRRDDKSFERRDDRSFGRRDDFNDRRPSDRRDDFNDRRPSDRRDDFNDRKSFGRRDDFNDRRSFGRRDDFNDRRPSNRRDDFNDRRQENSSWDSHNNRSNEGSFNSRDNKDGWSSDNWSKKSEREDRFKNSNDRSDTVEERKSKDNNNPSGW